ncbi:MAG: HEAT repeat domain-containing protein [Verrucomicrobiota bacterium]
MRSSVPKNPANRSLSLERKLIRSPVSPGENAPSTGATEFSPGQILPTQTNSVDERILELAESGSRSDPESFRKITEGLRDDEPEIRRAAREAVIQFGSRDAIPILKELAVKTEDAREKVELLDAAEFLKLPSLTEVRAQRRAGTNSTGIAPK